MSLMRGGWDPKTLVKPQKQFHLGTLRIFKVITLQMERERRVDCALDLHISLSKGFQVVTQ